MFREDIEYDMNMISVIHERSHCSVCVCVFFWFCFTSKSGENGRGSNGDTEDMRRLRGATVRTHAPTGPVSRLLLRLS